MKTPMQELRHEIEVWLDAADDSLVFAYKSVLEAIDESYLKKEKEYFMAYGFSCCQMTKQKKAWSLEDLFNEHFNTQENPHDSTNGYTYYPQENKTVFNAKEK